MSRKAIADKVVEKFISRKFLAWIVATCMLAGESLQSDHWSYLTMVYIGTQGAADIYKIVKGA